MAGGHALRKSKPVEGDDDQRDAETKSSPDRDVDEGGGGS